MKRLMSAVLVAAGVLLSVLPAFASDAPLWQRLSVSWVSSDSAGSYSVNPMAPVRHANGNIGWKISIFDTSTVVDITNAFQREAWATRLVTYDSSDVVPLLRIKPVYNTGNGVDSMRFILDASTGGGPAAVWFPIDSLNCNAVRNTVDFGGSGTVSGDSIICNSNSVDMIQVDTMAPQYGPKTTTINVTRGQLNRFRFIRLRSRRDYSTMNTPNTYTYDLWLWARPPFSASGPTSK